MTDQEKRIVHGLRGIQNHALVAKDAADLIMSLSARLSAKTELLDSAIAGQEALQRVIAADKSKYDELQRYSVDCTKQCGKLLVENADLRAQLAASQQRERAAVEDLKASLSNQNGIPCSYCSYLSAQYVSVDKYGGFWEEDCGYDGPGDCANGEHWEWRGPQAGEGEA